MKFIFSLLMAIFIGSVSCSAVDLDSVDFYSFDSLSPMTASALDYAVMPLASTSWDTSDQTNLARIMNAFYNPNSGYVSNSIIGWVKKIADNSIDLSDLASDILDIRDAFYLNKSGVDGSIISGVRDISNIYDVLVGPSGSFSRPAAGSVLSYIYNLAELPEIKSDTQIIENNTNSLLSSLSSYISWVQANRNVDLISPSGNPYTAGVTIPFAQSIVYQSLLRDATVVYSGTRSLYGVISQMQKVLASDDDLALAESQKANREEIEGSFLTGSSGSTSLGVSDFAGLSDVGGSVRDSLSLDGNASLTSFTSGLSAADSAGQGWFSESTRSQLDTVSASVTYSLRDPDPYNMSGWEDRYYWLIGDDD